MTRFAYWSFGLTILALLFACSTANRTTTIKREIPNVNVRSNPKEIEGKVVGITDGDTVTVYDGATQYKIRLAGIDAPESGQAFGKRSRQNLSELIFGKTVFVTSDKTDRYGRKVGVIRLDGVDINLKQIEAGFAWHYKQYENEQSESERSAYAETEARARVSQIGLWSDPKAIPPWDKRAAKRSKISKANSSNSSE